jgi:hypothetical protein
MIFLEADQFNLKKYIDQDKQHNNNLTNASHLLKTKAPIYIPVPVYTYY